MRQTISNITPLFIKKVYRNLFSKKSESFWSGNYASWDEAKKQCTGYEDTAILEKVKSAVLKVKNGEAAYERDSVLFDEIQYSEPLLNAFKSIASEKDGNLNVIDFGGSLGSTYYQNRGLLDQLRKLSWNVVEQSHFVECGKKYIQDDYLKFYYSIEDALAENKANVLLLSSVIPYFEKPYELIEKCLSYGVEYIIIDRTAFADSPNERITVQRVPEFIYKASYPAWFLNEQKFVNAFASEYSLISEFDSKFDPKEQLDDKIWSYRKGFVFKKK